jgi:hypothetical protein
MEPFPYSCEIVRRTAGTALDEYGNAISTLGTINASCDLQQVGRTEPGGSGEISITTWSLFLPVDAELDTGDMIRVNGKTYELTGDPWVADTMSDRVNHVEATVVRQGQG